VCVLGEGRKGGGRLLIQTESVYPFLKCKEGRFRGVAQNCSVELLIAHDHARLCDFLRDISVLSKITQPFTIIAH